LSIYVVGENSYLLNLIHELSKIVCSSFSLSVFEKSNKGKCLKPKDVLSKMERVANWQFRDWDAKVIKHPKWDW